MDEQINIGPENLSTNGGVLNGAPVKKQKDSKIEKKRKLISIILFIIIFGAFLYWAGVQAKRWYDEKQVWVGMGFAENKFPYRMYTERELVEKGLWFEESPALNAVPTRTTPEETYAKFRQALIDGNIDKAAECFVEEEREQIRKGLYNVQKNNLLSEMINDLPEKLEDTYIYTEDIIQQKIDENFLNNKSLESYIYALKSDPERNAQEISFKKNWDGDWLIKDI